MCYFLLLCLWILAFLSLAFLIYSLVLLWMVWTCAWNIQHRGDHSSYVYCVVYFCKLSIDSSTLLMINWNAPGQWAFLYFKWFSFSLITSQWDLAEVMLVIADWQLEIMSTSMELWTFCKELSVISRGNNSIVSFHKNDLMSVIICKIDKHLVKLYNVFLSMTCILSHLSYIFY